MKSTAVHMATSPTVVNIDQQRLTVALDQASKKLEGGEKEIVLDFSWVRRVTTADLGRLEEFAQSAEEKKVKVLLRGVNVDVYKALKLSKLTAEFWFVS